MDLLDRLEEKVIQALETIELLQMEKQELEEEIAALKKKNVGLDAQHSTWQSKVESLLGQFETDVAHELQQQKEDERELSA